MMHVEEGFGWIYWPAIEPLDLLETENNKGCSLFPTVFNINRINYIWDDIMICQISMWSDLLQIYLFIMLVVGTTENCLIMRDN